MIQLRSICLSAHLDSFCRKLDELDGLEFVYQTDDPGAMRRRVGWRVNASYKTSVISSENDARALECDILIEMLRELDLMEARAVAGKTTVYVSERWFKPLIVKGVRLPAILRLLSPSYFKMARRFVRLMDDSRFWVFPCGVHAVRDFVRLYRLLHGDFRCLFRTPKIGIERRLGGAIEGFPRIRLWGYFVEPSNCPATQRALIGSRVLKILWCGRMLDWKRVDVLIKAFKKVNAVRPASLLVVGEGCEKERLTALAGPLKVDSLGWERGKICFNGYVRGDKIRELMRVADVYVMSSNAEEGWGAAVTEALTESCPVISTFEAGSSATLLPARCLYHADNVDELVERLSHFNGENVEYNSNEWSGENAAKLLMEIVKC